MWKEAADKNADMTKSWEKYFDTFEQHAPIQDPNEALFESYFPTFGQQDFWTPPPPSTQTYWGQEPMFGMGMPEWK